MFQLMRDILLSGLRLRLTTMSSSSFIMIRNSGMRLMSSLDLSIMCLTNFSLLLLLLAQQEALTQSIFCSLKSRLRILDLFLIRMLLLDCRSLMFK